MIRQSLLLLAFWAPLAGLDAPLPASSLTSPLCVEAVDVQPVTVDGVPATPLGGGRWFRDVALQESAATPIVVAAGGSRVSGSVLWQPIDVASPPVAHLAVRVGDAIRLRSGAAPIVIRRPDGSESTAAAGSMSAIRFHLPGTYRMLVDGVESFTVQAAGLGFDRAALAGRALALKKSNNVTFTLPAGSVDMGGFTGAPRGQFVCDNVAIALVGCETCDTAIPDGAR